MKAVVLSAPMYHGTGDDMSPARAVLASGTLGATITVEQYIEKSDRWISCSRWYLDSLLDSASDTIAIDYGQHWYAHGMRTAVLEAAKLVARAYKDQTA